MAFTLLDSNKPHAPLSVYRGHMGSSDSLPIGSNKVLLPTPAEAVSEEKPWRVRVVTTAGEGAGMMKSVLPLWYQVEANWGAIMSHSYPS